MSPMAGFNMNTFGQQSIKIAKGRNLKNSESKAQLTYAMWNLHDQMSTRLMILSMATPP